MANEAESRYDEFADEEMTADEAVELAIYDLSGRQITTLLSRKMPPGNHQVIWDGRDAAGHLMSSGTYVVRLRIGHAQQSFLLVLIR